MFKTFNVAKEEKPKKVSQKGEKNLMTKFSTRKTVVERNHLNCC